MVTNGGFMPFPKNAHFLGNKHQEIEIYEFLMFQMTRICHPDEWALDSPR
jgi:hypothetical protein